MKRIYLFLSFFLITCKGFSVDLYSDPTLEFKAGYFIFADSKMRSVYNKGGLDIQFSGSFPFSKRLQIYASAEFLHRHGESLSGDQSTHIWEIPVTIGLKSIIKLAEWAGFYFTLAPRYFYLHVHNDSSYVDSTLHKNGIGGFAGTGFTFVPYTNFLLDIFGEFSYQKVHIHTSKTNVYTRSLQVGGFTFGAGLGYAF